MCLDSSLPHLSLRWGFSFTSYVLLLWAGRNHAQKLLGSTGGVQWCRSSLGDTGLLCVVVEALLARKKGMEFIRWKVTAHMRGSCLYIFRTDART